MKHDKQQPFRTRIVVEDSATRVMPTFSSSAPNWAIKPSVKDARDGATVRVDGVNRDAVPATPGSHQIIVTRPNHGSWQASVFVAREAPGSVVVEPKFEPEPKTTPWPYVAVGGFALALGTGIGALILHHEMYDRYEAYKLVNSDPVTLREGERAIKSAQTERNILLAATALGVVAGTVGLVLCVLPAKDHLANGKGHGRALVPARLSLRGGFSYVSNASRADMLPHLSVSMLWPN